MHLASLIRRLNHHYLPWSAKLDKWQTAQVIKPRKWQAASTYSLVEETLETLLLRATRGETAGATLFSSVFKLWSSSPLSAAVQWEEEEPWYSRRAAVRVFKPLPTQAGFQVNNVRNTQHSIIFADKATTYLVNDFVKQLRSFFTGSLRINLNVSK